MSELWSPEVPVDRALVERVLTERFPSLDPASLVHAGSGWDHDVWRCGDVLLRFPVQEESLCAGRDRSFALGELGPRLPIAVPAPVLHGPPTAAYPGHVVGYRWIGGDLPARLPLSIEDRSRAAPLLAELTRAVHAVSLDEALAWGLAVEGERGNMADRARFSRERADQLSSTPFAELADRAASAMSEPPPEVTAAERRVVHGDLHAGQVLFDTDHELVGVIDWDSLAIGDPAFDLLMAYSFVPPSARVSFWDRYGETTAAPRARHLALSYGLALLAQGVATGDDGVRDEAAFSLKNALP